MGNNFPGLTQSLKKFAEQTKKNLDSKWSQGKSRGFHGNAGVLADIEEKDNNVRLKLSFCGQRMWTMEFGKGYSRGKGKTYYDKKGFVEEWELGKMSGIKLTVIRSQMFTDYINSREVDINPSRKGKTGVEAARIYTRPKGVYMDIDGNPQRGSGIGYSKDGKGEGIPINAFAVDADNTIAKELHITDLHKRNKAKWVVNKTELLHALDSGLKNDFNAILKEALAKGNKK